MKKILKLLAVIGSILYIAQAMVGICYGIQYGVWISTQIERKVN